MERNPYESSAGILNIEFSPVQSGAIQEDAPDQTEILRLAYEAFSKDETGGTNKREGISALRLHKVLKKMGEEMTHVAIDEMIHFGDTNNNGRLSLEEFENVIRLCNSEAALEQLLHEPLTPVTPAHDPVAATLSADADSKLDGLVRQMFDPIAADVGGIQIALPPAGQKQGESPEEESSEEEFCDPDDENGDESDKVSEVRGL